MANKDNKNMIKYFIGKLTELVPYTKNFNQTFFANHRFHPKRLH